MKTTQTPPWNPGPAPAYSAVDTLTVTAIMLAALLAMLIVIPNPVAAGGAVAVTIVAGLFARNTNQLRKGRFHRSIPLANKFVERGLDHAHHSTKRV